MSDSSQQDTTSQRQHVSRRTFLKWATAGLGLTLAACAPAIAPTAAPAAPPTSAPAAPAAPAATAAPAAPAATKAPAAPAAASGNLVVYSALNETTNNAFVDAFKKAQPAITVQLLPLAAAGELQTRIQTEKNSPKGDIFIGGSSEFHDPLGKAGLLEAYKSPNATAVANEYKDPNGFWTGWYLGIFGLIINSDRFAKEMATVKKPATWDDLLDPGWKGNKLIYPDPVKTGGGYIFIATQVFRFNKDEDKAMDYMKKLHANIAQYVGTSPQAIQLVSQGQFIACPNWSHDILTAKSQGNPVELVVPANTGFEIGGISIIKGGPNTAAAKSFVDWSLTQDAGALNVKLSNRLSTRTDVPPAPGAPTLQTVTMVNYDRAWATDNKDRLLKKWQAAVGI